MKHVPNMANWDRAMSLAVGAALIAYAWKRRRLTGSVMTTGLGFVARAATGSCPGYAAVGFRTRSDEPHEVLGGSGGIRVKESILIHADAADLFRVWDNVDNIPIFMEHVESVVRLDDRTSRWTVRAPGGLSVSWDAEIINRIDPHLIAWKSLPGADVVSAGSVRFTPRRRGRTEVTVHMQYEPPFGRAGAFGAWLAGHDPRTSLREDLRRLKRLTERTGDEWVEVGANRGPRRVTA